MEGARERKNADVLKLFGLIKVENEGLKLQRSDDEFVCEQKLEIPVEKIEQMFNKFDFRFINLLPIAVFVMVKLEPATFPSVHLFEFIDFFRKCMMCVCVFGFKLVLNRKCTHAHIKRHIIQNVHKSE